jgi:hypothetical protein
VSALKTPGGVVTGKRDGWDMRFEQLFKYKERFGTCKVGGLVCFIFFILVTCFGKEKYYYIYIYIP